MPALAILCGGTLLHLVKMAQGVGMSLLGLLGLPHAEHGSPATRPLQ